MSTHIHTGETFTIKGKSKLNTVAGARELHVAPRRAKRPVVPHFFSSLSRSRGRSHSTFLPLHPFPSLFRSCRATGARSSARASSVSTRQVQQQQQHQQLQVEISDDRVYGFVRFAGRYRRLFYFSCLFVFFTILFSSFPPGLADHSIFVRLHFWSASLPQESPRNVTSLNKWKDEKDEEVWID